jgi:hypothetical protein
MKTAFAIIGVVFLFLLVLGGTAIGVFAYYGTQFDASSKAYTEESVRAIAANWSKDELVSRESEALHKAASDDQLTQLFALFSKLGPLQSYDGATGDSNMGFTPATGPSITARYVAEITCQNGKAEVKVALIRVNGQWQIYGFHVDSPLFLAKPN